MSFIRVHAHARAINQAAQRFDHYRIILIDQFLPRPYFTPTLCIYSSPRHIPWSRSTVAEYIDKQESYPKLDWNCLYSRYPGAFRRRVHHCNRPPRRRPPANVMIPITMAARMWAMQYCLSPGFIRIQIHFILHGPFLRHVPIYSLRLGLGDFSKFPTSQGVVTGTSL